MMSDPSRTAGYEDLLVWQKSIALVKLIYRITKEFAGDEQFGLVSQMRRAAVSIPSNIAEGQARHTTGEFIQFVSHAEGSNAELNTQLIVSVELGYCDRETAKEAYDLITEIRKMLNGLRRTLQTRRR